MKPYLTLIFLTVCISSFGQTNFNKLIQKAKVLSLPYSSESEENRLWFVNSDKQIKLHSSDSAFVVEKLKSISRTIVNPKGGTSFGDLDCMDQSDYRLQEIGEIALLNVIKNTIKKNYLLHIEVREYGEFGLWHGILACVTFQGEIKSWIYSNGSANGGNPHGNIYRSFKVRSNNVIYIDEGAWGDNTDTYGFTATYKVVGNKFVLIKRKLFPGTK